MKSAVGVFNGLFLICRELVNALIEGAMPSYVMTTFLLSDIANEKGGCTYSSGAPQAGPAGAFEGSVAATQSRCPGWEGIPTCAPA